MAGITKEVICINLNGKCSICFSNIPFDGVACDGPHHHVVDSKYWVGDNVKNHSKTKKVKR